ITKFDPEEDPNEDDDEDPEEDPADYPTDRDDDDEEEDFSEDDADDEEEDGGEDEEEEHLALADSVPPPAYRTTTRMSIRAQTPIPFPSEIEKSLCIALGPRFKVEQCLSAPTARPTGGFRVDYGFIDTLDAKIRHDPDREIGHEIIDVWEDPDEIAEEIRVTDVAELSQRMIDFITTIQSMDARDTARYDVRELQTTVLSKKTEIGELWAADRRRQVHLTEALTLLRTLQTQMVALQSHQRPARDPAHPDVSEEAGSSS
nr:hypothetical protein [Tanacetum cinerariifolium]